MADEEKLGEAFYKQLLLGKGEQWEQFRNSTLEGHQFLPKPGFVIKLRNSKDEKVFINVCLAENVPAPKEISEKELVKLLESVDASQYRVPISLGEPHAEVDNRGQGCTAYDVVINPVFHNKIQHSELFKSFFLTIVFEGLESKYNIELDRNWTLLKNKKCMGILQPHFVRSKSKPFIMEMESKENQASAAEALSKRPVIEEVTSNRSDMNTKVPTPKYTVIKEPPEGKPEFLVIEIALPGVKSTKQSTLDVGEDKLVLHVNPNKYHLDLELPFSVNNETCGAQYNRKTKILTLTLPVIVRS